MIRTASLFTLVALTLSSAACSKKSGGGDQAAASGGSVAGGEAAKAPTIKITEADWVMKDLHAVSPLVNISMKVPKDAKLEKNGNGGVDVTIDENYQLTIGNIAVSSIDEAKKSDKSLTIENASSYINGKVLSEDPNGFVYTMQMKDEDNGTKYQPEAHFAYYIEKDGAVYSILDAKPLTSSLSIPGSTYSEALAKQVYAIVKGSAKAN